MNFGLETSGSQICRKDKNGFLICHPRLQPTNYMKLVRTLTASSQNTSASSSVVETYAVAILVFYVALLLIVIVGVLRRSDLNILAPPPPAGRKHLLTIDPTANSATPTLSEPRHGHKSGAVDV